MSRNVLKIIACISMLLDHVGYILFPEIKILRFIGRIALPIFAFFIAEGCRFTKNRPKYFIRILSLALLCQTVFLMEEIVGGSFERVYFNILFTLSMSIILCCLYLNMEKSIKENDKRKLYYNLSAFIVMSAFFACLCTLGDKLPFPLKFDYGFAGVFLPLFAVLSKDKNKRFILFTLGLIIFNIATLTTISYTWFSLISLIPLYFYNGKKGKAFNNLAFYAFYPLHIAAIYGIKLLFF